MATITTTPPPAAETGPERGPNPGEGGRPAPRRPSRWSATRIGGALGLVLAALVFAVPLYWLARSALMPESDIHDWPPGPVPFPPTLENFARAMELAPFDVFLFNSVLVAVVGTVLKVILAVTTAYAFAFLPFPMKNLLFFVMIGALMVPGHVTLLVNYITTGELGLINTYAGIILPGVASAFGTFLLRQHFMSLPREVLEAAELDGAGHLRRLWSFVAPMARPAIVTVALVALIDEWNGFVWPLIATNSLEMRTLPIGLIFLKSADDMQEWGAIMAGASMVALPMLLVFLFAQRYIVSGLTGATLRR